MLAARFRLVVVGMLDTVTIGAHVEGLRAGALLDRGWAVHSTVSQTGGNLWASTELGGVRLAFMSGIGWLSGEVSLPKLLDRDNAELLSPSECREAVGLLCNVIESSAGGVSRLDDWSVSRFDAVWAWPVDASLYLGALAVARLPRTERVGYESGVRWVGGGNRVKGRAYDKGLEERRDVDLPFRLELQVRRKQKLRVDGLEVGRSLEDILNERVCLGVVAKAASDLGLDKPIPSMAATRAVLVSKYGTTAGRAAWAVLRDVWEAGGVWPSDVKPWTRRRVERRWREAGVSAVSPEGELPPLTVGSRG